MGRLIEVDEEHFKAIEKDSHFLECLTSCGVSDWHGFEAALKEYESEIEDDN